MFEDIELEFLKRPNIAGSLAEAVVMSTFGSSVISTPSLIFAKL